MQATAEHLEFAPPATRGWVRALMLAVAAHVLLMAALTWGVSWKRDSVSVVASAELWSAVPQEAAPAPVPEPPAPPPAPPQPKAPPEPETKAPEVDADIALEREKKRKRLERIEEIRKEQEDRRKQAALDKEKKKQAALDKEKQRLEQIEREKKLAQDKRDKQALAKAEAQREQLDTQRIEVSRQENLKRMMAGVAGATGSTEATGTAKQSSGPSATYAGKIVERIRNNTSFTDANAGKPTVIVDVRVNSSGTIMSRRVTQTSGNRAYDDAVLKAIDKMEFLPKDSDGRIPALVLSEGLELKVTL